MIVTEKDVRTYTCGSCHLLAAAIHERTGWPLATFGRYGFHWFVITPDGRCLDIEGIRSQEQMIERWERAEVISIDVKDPIECDRLISEWYMPEAEYEAARAFVPYLISLAAL